jgi:hypothetical protein
VAGEKDAPLAAILCYGTGSLTIIGGVLALLDRHEGLFCWWVVVQLGGAIVTTLLGLASLLRHEEWKFWTILCVIASLAPLAIGFLISK